MPNPIQVTGPHASPSGDRRLSAQCEVCGSADYLDLRDVRAFEGKAIEDLASAIRAVLEWRPLLPAQTPEEAHLQKAAFETATHFYRDLKSYGCLHCPLPVAITMEVKPGSVRLTFSTEEGAELYRRLRRRGELVLH